jgi:hypothetical protein
MSSWLACLARCLALWRQSHTSLVFRHCADIEALTAKACSLRRYEAFVAMLLAALQRTSSSVSLEILSSSDLAAMKLGAHHAAVKSSSARSSASSSKQYVILTYVSEFERIHYPLPLALQNGVEDMPGDRTVPATAAAGPAMGDLLAEISHLRKECSALRRQLRNSRHESHLAHNSEASAALQRVRSAGYRAMIIGAASCSVIRSVPQVPERSAGTTRMITATFFHWLQAFDERDAALSNAQAARSQAQRMLTPLRRQLQEAQHQAACSTADLERARAEARRWRARCQQGPLEAQPPGTWRRGASRPHRWGRVLTACRVQPWATGPGHAKEEVALQAMDQHMILAVPAQWTGTCRGATALTAHGDCRGTQLPGQPSAAHQACLSNKIARRSWRFVSVHMSGLYCHCCKVLLNFWDLSAVSTSKLAASRQAAARPWSAPATRQLFDPTKYVREQQQRERLLAARFGRRPVTPGVSSRRTSMRSAGRPESTASGVASRLCAGTLTLCQLQSDVIVLDTRP